jgi:hypothetical protein
MHVNQINTTIMKKCLILIAITLITKSATAQQAVDALSDVLDIATYSNIVTKTLIIKNEKRGGVFNLYTGYDIPDNGMIFLDGIRRKWLRQTSDEKINLQWYGAKSTSLSTPYDIRNNIIAARDYIYAHKKFNTLYIPYDKSGLGYYDIGDSIVFNQSINIKGDGFFFEAKTILSFPENKTGLIIKYNNGEIGIKSEISNLKLQSKQGGTGPFYINRHGISANAIIKIDNVEVFSFGGDGLHIESCAIRPAGENKNYGNSDGSSIKNFKATACRNGIYLEGCDANSILFENIDVSSNRRWGVYDNGQLGNNYIKPHTAFNGVAATNGLSVVKYAEKFYTARPGYDGYFTDATDSNYNKRPDLNPSYWLEVTSMTHTLWNDYTRYYSGGPICIRHPSARSNILNAYTEPFQPPIYLNPRSKVDGGDNGAGVHEGSFHAVYAGEDYFFNADQVLPNTNWGQHKITIGENKIDESTVLKINNDINKSGIYRNIFSETNSSVVYHRLKNIYTNSDYGLSNNDFVHVLNNVIITRLNTSEYKPATDNLINLGSPTEKWKNIYGVNLYGNGANITAINQSAVVNLSADLEAIKRKYGNNSVVGSNSNITVVAGSIIHLPAGTLTASRTINLSGLNTDNDYLEIQNNQSGGFVWSFTGQTVYLSDRTTTLTVLPIGIIILRRINGKLIKLN